MIDEKRWEYGSSFHWVDPLQLDHFSNAGQSRAYPWSTASADFATGRDVLRALCRFGSRDFGWRRLRVPAYYCQEVVRALLEAYDDHHLELLPYDDHPALDEVEIPDLLPGDAVLVTNYFGLRPSTAAKGLRGPGVSIIEDHTHDPLSSWAMDSDADFAFASLRKTLPLADGAVVWSPQDHELPPVPSTPALTRAAVVGVQRDAMVLKSLYLEGAAVEKTEFRKLSLAGEAGIAVGPVAPMSALSRNLLRAYPLEHWRKLRQANYTQLKRKIYDECGLFPLAPMGPDCVPYCVALVFDDPGQRDAVAAQLIASRVYPSVLWRLDDSPLAPVREDLLALSQRMLGLACDFRYDNEDLERVVKALARCLRPG